MNKSTFFSLLSAESSSNIVVSSESVLICILEQRKTEGKAMSDKHDIMLLGKSVLK